MTSIEEMYNRILDVVQDVDSAVYIHADEGTGSVVVGGNKDIPQTIEVEFSGEVPNSLNEELLQAVNGTGWEYVDEHDVFNGDNPRNGLISISRNVDRDDVPAFRQYSEEKYF